MKVVLLVLLGALSMGCATSGVPQMITNTWILPAADKDDLWDSAVATVISYGWPPLVIDGDSGVLTTDWVSANRGEFDCGDSGITAEYQHEMRVTVNVSNGPSLTVSVLGRAMRSFDSQSWSVECFSRGIVERRFRAATESRMVASGRLPEG